jgi:UDP-N-acetylmuramoylalanine--D-glutamate ligase
MQAYCADKARIFGETTIQVLNRDDALVMSMLKPQAAVISFGVDAPEHIGDLGLLNEHGMGWLAVSVAAEDVPVVTSRRKKKKQKKFRHDHATDANGCIADSRAA